MYTCGVDHHNETEEVSSYVGTHFTGDKKYHKVRYCADCDKHFFFVEMDVSLSYASNLFVFRIELTDVEVKEMLAMMEDTQECSRVEKYLDTFDSKNKERRVILKDEYYDQWYR